MRRSEIVRAIADHTGLTQVKAEDVVDIILEEIKQTLSRGEPVILRRFGVFAVYANYAKNARQGRNPKTGEPAEITARHVIRFKPGKPFKDAVNHPDR